jgi:hypothetical protein
MTRLAPFQQTILETQQRVSETGKGATSTRKKNRKNNTERRIIFRCILPSKVRLLLSYRPFRLISTQGRLSGPGRKRVSPRRPVLLGPASCQVRIGMHEKSLNRINKSRNDIIQQRRGKMEVRKGRPQHRHFCATKPHDFLPGTFSLVYQLP